MILSDQMQADSSYADAVKRKPQTETKQNSHVRLSNKKIITRKETHGTTQEALIPTGSMAAPESTSLKQTLEDVISAEKLTPQWISVTFVKN